MRATMRRAFALSAALLFATAAPSAFADAAAAPAGSAGAQEGGGEPATPEGDRAEGSAGASRAAAEAASSEGPESKPAAGAGAAKGEAEEEEDEEDEEIEEVEEVGDPNTPDTWWGEGYALIDRAVNIHFPVVTRKFGLRLIIDHRTRQSLVADPDRSVGYNLRKLFHDYFGFDAGGLKIGLGVRFGAWDNLDVGFYRLSNGGDAFDVYEIDAKYQLLHQDRFFVDLALRAGMTWFSQPDADDALAGFGQLLVGRRFFDRLTVVTGLLFHSDSSNGVKSNLDTAWSLAIPLVVDVRILSWLAWNVEVAINVAGYGTRDKDDVNSWPVFSSSLKFITNRHTFALVLSNSEYVTADGVVANSPRGFDQVIVGFSITRQWELADSD